MSALSFLIASARTVGVSGSRSPSPASLAVCCWALGQLAPGAGVVTGCASGIDAAARAPQPAPRPAPRVVRASPGVPPVAALAARSTAVVRHVASAPPGCGLWLSFPSGACPAGLVPSASASACFAGYGSGSWASLALAVGLGVPALVFLPPGVAVPPGWPLAPVAGCAGARGAWVRFRPAVVQPSLFAI